MDYVGAVGAPHGMDLRTEVNTSLMFIAKQAGKVLKTRSGAGPTRPAAVRPSSRTDCRARPLGCLPGR